LANLPISWQCSSNIFDKTTWY